MNIEQATSIPLVLILDILCYIPVQHKNYEILYPSPFSKRSEDYLRVFPLQNIWVDDFLNKQGNTVTFVMAYLQREGQCHTVNDALRWIANMTGRAPKIEPISFQENILNEPGLTIKDVSSIRHRGLINYLVKKGISHKVANRYLKQIRVYRPERRKSFLALGLRNEDNGWEIFNPYFRGYRGTKNINFIRGRPPKPDGIHLFKDIFDFLSVLMQRKKARQLDYDSLILNSLSLLPSATPYIKDYGYQYVHSWMDNDEQGRAATKSLDDFLRTEKGLKHNPQNHLYRPYKDINAWHVANLESAKGV